MKQVHALEILGNPERIDRDAACPSCHERSMVFEDGSIMCILENKCFAPEADKDPELFAIRQEFDRKNGITPSDRLLIPARLKQEAGIA